MNRNFGEKKNLTITDKESDTDFNCIIVKLKAVATSTVKIVETALPHATN